MSTNLNLVETTLKVAGAECYFSHLELNQQMNSHHTFSIKIDYEEYGKKWMENPIQIIQLMGKEVEITMVHRQTGDMNLFKGIVSSAYMSGEHGEKNYYILEGHSPTIKLDGKPTMDSFIDQNLENIVNEVVETSGNGAEVTVKPAFKGTIDYICQYQESTYHFMQRLAWMYGEWNFYDGTTHYFGRPDDLGDPVEITYDTELTHFNLGAHILPAKYKRYDYLTHLYDEAQEMAPTSVDGVRGYIKAALDEADKIFQSEGVLPLKTNVGSMEELKEMIEVEKYRTVSQMLTMQGTGQTSRIKIGKLIKVKLPKTMEVPVKEVETFLVTDLKHIIDQDGTYYNKFSGIPSEMKNIPMDPIETPVAYPQVAWVKDNADSKGRVKVQFQWQKEMQKTTNFIRVQTPDAGMSDKVGTNRGMVHIPESGDFVMIGFEYGSPDRPYVAGSIFPENQGAGGGAGNKSKSITTRVASSLTFDDAEGSVTIKDQQGSDSTITMDGQQNIVVNAGESITLVCGESIIVLEKDGTITINGKKIYTAAANEINISTGDLEGGVCSGISIEPNDIGITAINDIIEVAQNVTLGAGPDGKNVVALDGGAGEITVNGSKINLN